MAGEDPNADPTFGGILIITALVIGLFCRNVVSKVTRLPYTVRVRRTAGRSATAHRCWFDAITLCRWTAALTHTRQHVRGCAQVVLLIFGGILGGVAHRATTGQLSDSIHIWAEVDPHALLYLFLPLLVFESSFNVDCA